MLLASCDWRFDWQRHGFNGSGSCGVPAWDAKLGAAVAYFAESGNSAGGGDLPEEVLLMRVAVPGE